MSAATAAYLVGRGISDVTGEAFGAGMLGYGKADQVSAGIHLRLRSRAFVVVDPSTDACVVLSISDLPLMFDSVRRAVLRRLHDRYGGRYHEANVMLTVTHTHSGPGGYSHHRLYNLTTHGFRPKTFAAVVDGIVEAVERAHDDLAPAVLRLGHGELHDASVNRSPQAFARNPAPDRAFFPAAIDPQLTVLRVDRDERTVGSITWFATHGTSMSNRNRLISGDNKGYAAYHCERLSRGVDYLDAAPPEFVAAFAQTNAGDMSPNLGRQARRGPTDDELANTRVIGERQARAAERVCESVERVLSGGLDARLTHVDLGAVTVRPEFTGDGRTHVTSGPAGGAAAVAGTDEGRGFPGFRQGRNAAFDAVSVAAYGISARHRDAQSPKGIVLPGRLLNRVLPFVPERVPVQLLRIGALFLVGIPGEVTITAGLRMRRVVAAAVGAELRDVLIAGYSNGYIHYVTTPEEYDEQRYEGGSTLFGRWEAPALTQVAAGLAEAMRDGRPVDRGDAAPDLTPGRAAGALPQGHAGSGRRLGSVVRAPLARYRPGERVTATFVVSDPTTVVRRGATYCEVQAHAGVAGHAVDDTGWTRVADDGDWSTTVSYTPPGRDCADWQATVSWDIPAGVPEDSYRLVYTGDRAVGPDDTEVFAGRTEPFTIAADV